MPAVTEAAIPFLYEMPTLVINVRTAGYLRWEHARHSMPAFYLSPIDITQVRTTGEHRVYPPSPTSQPRRPQQAWTWR